MKKLSVAMKNCTICELASLFSMLLENEFKHDYEYKIEINGDIMDISAVENENDDEDDDKIEEI